MKCKLITENDCLVNAVLSLTPVELLIMYKAVTRCVNDEAYHEFDRAKMKQMSEAMKNFEQVEVGRGEWIVEIKDGLPHLQRMTELVRCNQCKHYEGVHDVPGCAPCAFWGIGAVMWDDFCKRGERND